MLADQPLVDIGWIGGHAGDIVLRTLQHLGLSALAIGVGFLVAFAVATLAARQPRLLAPLIAGAGVLYTIPSLALFAALVPFTGLSLLTAEIPLVLYTQLVLIRGISAGFAATPPEVLEAADGLGYTRRQRFLAVELPLAIPLIVTAVRLASVSTIGLVMVVTLIGNNFGGLGLFIKEGIASFFPTKVYVGAALSVLLAVAADAALARLERRLAPWSQSSRDATVTELASVQGLGPAGA
jgi:osmoprotectant transport system permease protein